MGDQLEFVDDNEDVRLAGSLLDPGAAEGDVLTVQADGSVAAAPAGGGAPTEPYTAAATVLQDSNSNPLIFGDGSGVVVTDGAGSGIDVDGEVSMGAPAVNVQTISGGTLGFYSVAGVAQPVVPMTTPTVQSVIDALVALGLVSQSD